MKKIVAAGLLIVSMTTWAWSQNRGAQVDRVQTASTVLDQIMSAPDRAIPDGILSGAKCIAIVPSMLKASFVFGANYGKGVATCRTDHGWSAPVFFKVTGGSFGFQAGGQASDLVLIIRTDDGMQHLLQSKFKLGADASAAAGPVGRDAQASTDLTLRAQVLTYSRSRGLFLGVSLSGGVIRQDDGDTRAFYGGKDWTFYSLLRGQIPAPQDSLVLLNTVEKYAPTPKVRAQVAPGPVVTSPAPAATPAETPATSSPADPAQAPAAVDPTTEEPAAAPTAATPSSATAPPVAATPASSGTVSP
jgi:lipid-binding SYLF domain-containing protein